MDFPPTVPKRVLVVDDNPANLEILSDYLEGCGFETLTAKTGADGVAMAAAHHPSIILMDVMMPGMDGFQACRELKSRPETRGIPVIFMTALTAVEDKARGFSAGGADYVTKPFQQEEVLVRVGNHLRILEQTRALERQADELRQSIARLGEARDRLVQAEKMAALGSLVAGVAHEINTPVGNGVTAASFLDEISRQLLAKGERGALTMEDCVAYAAAARESASIILATLQHAAELVRSFKQIAVDQSHSERRFFDLKLYLEEVFISLHPQYSRSGHSVQWSCPDGIGLYADPGLFMQILSNLLGNSLVHGFEGRKGGGEIRVAVEPGGDTIVMRYSDNGVGMDAACAARLYEPFFTTRRGRGGTGLGMHIVFNAVTHGLGGTISCQTSPGAGVSFTIEFPWRKHPDGPRPPDA